MSEVQLKILNESEILESSQKMSLETDLRYHSKLFKDIIKSLGNLPLIIIGVEETSHGLIKEHLDVLSDYFEYRSPKAESLPTFKILHSLSPKSALSQKNYEPVFSARPKSPTRQAPPPPIKKTPLTISSLPPLAVLEDSEKAPGKEKISSEKISLEDYDHTKDPLFIPIGE